MKRTDEQTLCITFHVHHHTVTVEAKFVRAGLKKYRFLDFKIVSFFARISILKSQSILFSVDE